MTVLTERGGKKQSWNSNGPTRLKQPKGQIWKNYKMLMPKHAPERHLQEQDRFGIKMDSETIGAERKPIRK